VTVDLLRWSFPAAPDMDRPQVAAFDTLPHGLTRDAETAGGLLNGDKALVGFVEEARNSS
jgi:hypothetical protein